MAMFYLRKGPLGGARARHRPHDRALHVLRARGALDATPSASSVLAVSGIVMAFGKFFLLPVLGATLFGWLSYALKTLHNFVGPVFAVSLVVVFLTFVRDNLPRPGDMQWLAKGGGMLGGERSAVAPLQRRREGRLLGRGLRARASSSWSRAWC